MTRDNAHFAFLRELHRIVMRFSKMIFSFPGSEITTGIDGG